MPLPTLRFNIYLHVVTAESVTGTKYLLLSTFFKNSLLLLSVYVIKPLT